MSAEDNVASLLEELVSEDVGAAVSTSAIASVNAPVASVEPQSVVVSGPAGDAVFPAGSAPVVDTNLPVVDAPAAEPYLAIFDEIVGQLDTLGADSTKIAAAGDQDGRLAAALGFIKNQQELNEKMYALLVEMSNMMAKN